jgi:quercetin dioxygenase-like cupin family protein
MSFAFAHSRSDEPPILIPAIGLELRVRLRPAATGGALAVIETRHAALSGPPLHRHAEAEVFHVLEGRHLFEVNGRRIEAGPGDVVSVPGGAAHAFLALSEGENRLMVLILPGFDPAAFFTELGAAMAGGAPDPAALAAFGKKWGVEFLGPPLRA